MALATIRNRLASNMTTEYWTCDLRGTCPGRAVTKNNRHDYKETTPHNHIPDPVRREIREIRNTMKVAATNAIGTNTTTNIIQAGLIQASDAATAVLPTTDHLKRNIQRQRNAAQVPIPLPLQRDDIRVPLDFQMTANVNLREQFLLWDSGAAIGDEQRIFMFGTQKPGFHANMQLHSHGWNF